MASKADKANDKKATERKVTPQSEPTVNELSESVKRRNEARLKAVGDASDNNTGKTYGVAEPNA